jgi:electron transfer flavoprotein alpha subunit
MFIDGIEFAGHAVVIALGVTIDGTKTPLGIWAGSTENTTVVTELLSNLVGRGLRVEQSMLFVIDGGQGIRKALIKVVPAGSIVLAAHEHFGIDLAPGLSIQLNAAYGSDVLAIEGFEGNQLKVVRQEFGGQISAHVRCEISSGAVITIRPGAFKPLNGASLNGNVVDKSAEIGPLSAGRRYLQTIVAEAGEVDITKHAILVSVGRGIQEKDNIGIAQELADVLGAAVSCSRPVVDAKWLEKSRQVGSSGKTVKPKVYLACGISGAFQHLAGIKGNPFMVAINKNPKAPIFQVADVGIVDDLLEFLPELTNKVRELRGIPAK